MKEKSFKTTCSYCGVGCGIIVKKNAKGSLAVEGDADHPVNKGMLCSKGRNLHHVVQDTSDRILYPEIYRLYEEQLKPYGMARIFYECSFLLNSSSKPFLSIGFFLPAKRNLNGI